MEVKLISDHVYWLLIPSSWWTNIYLDSNSRKGVFFQSVWKKMKTTVKVKTEDFFGEKFFKKENKIKPNILERIRLKFYHCYLPAFQGEKTKRKWNVK